jgi:predicted nucleic acid-binding Zn ribbon protein
MAGVVNLRTMKTRQKNKDVTHIGDILSKSVGALAGRADLELLSLWETWTEAVGEEVACHTRPKAFKGTLLLVTVDSSVWMHHLSMMKHEIIARINKKLGEETLREIRFSIGHLETS